MKYKKRKPCDAVVAEFIYGPKRCGERPTRTIRVLDPMFPITDVFHTCAEHDPEALS